MRIRTIKPEFWAHPVMVRQDDAAKLLALGLLNYADDEGYFYADAKLVRASLRPLDEDSTIVRRCIDELSRIGYISLREHSSHGPVGRVVSFADHQRVDRPKESKIKPLFESVSHSPSEVNEGNRRTIDDESTNARDKNVAGKEGNREQGTGKGKEGAAPAAAVAVAFPPELDTPEFQTAWADWLAYRRETKRPTYKPTALAGQLKALADWGHEAAIDSIRVSIRQQWQGLFEPKGGPSNASKTTGGHPFQMPSHDHTKGF